MVQNIQEIKNILFGGIHGGIHIRDLVLTFLVFRFYAERDLALIFSCNDEILKLYVKKTCDNLTFPFDSELLYYSAVRLASFTRKSADFSGEQKIHKLFHYKSRNVTVYLNVHTINFS